MKKLFQKILIANRGEIAVRIIRTAHKLGIHTVAVYADDDARSMHVSLAGEAFRLSGSVLAETYLNQDKLIELALKTGAEAIHPGYGFLSENAIFARKVEQSGLIFIGATADQISLMGEKTRAIEFVKRIGIPIIPGIQGGVNEIISELTWMEFPLLIKASAGGGGKGMQIIEHAKDLPLALQKAGRQACEYFGNSELFVEKYVSNARHIEVQLMGDGDGQAVHMFERECSIQRRYQKLIEEAPALAISSQLKEQLYGYALQIAKSIKYRGAGTIEFLIDDQENCYFLEMNTRLQVEHPVTEMITGLDLVEWQLRVAAGNGLPMRQDQIIQNGYAIETRICAEDPEGNFLPSSGLIAAIHIPEEIRWDSFILENEHLPSTYDSLLGKLIVHESSREEAIEKLHDSLKSVQISGIKTNQLFLLQVIQTAAFRSNDINTRFIEDNASVLINAMHEEKELLPADLILSAYLLHHFYRPSKNQNRWSQVGYWRIYEAFQIELGSRSYNLSVKRRNDTYLMMLDNEPVELTDVLYTNKQITFKRNGIPHTVFVTDNQGVTIVQYLAHQFELKSRYVDGQINLKKQSDSQSGEAHSQVVADLFGKVVEVLVEPGEQLIKGQNLLVIESMKTEFTVQSPVDAVVKTIYVSRGKMVQDKEILVDFESKKTKNHI